jgi:death-on-curing protein
LIESALARPLQRWTYDESADLADLAASYAFGIAKNHGFVDGNKRTAFLALYVFLGLNGKDFDAAEPEVVSVMLAVAGGELSEDELAAWVRERWVEAEK